MVSSAKQLKVSKGAVTKERIVTATAELIHSQGYHATGLNQIIKESGSPKGSLYFHFPDGKDEIIEAALMASGDQVSQLLMQAFSSSDNAQIALESCVAYFKSELASTNFLKGCPVATVALEAAGEKDRIQRACAHVYEEWLAIIERGLGETNAKYASLILTLIEGALVLSKASKSTEPLDKSLEHILALLEG